jgi:hypothetical protein
VALASALGWRIPPVVTLISTEVVVLEPVYPPTATAVITHISSRRERALLIQARPGGPTVGSRIYIPQGRWWYRGAAARLNHALTPVLPDVGDSARSKEWSATPKTHSLPAITAEPGTLTPLGILARVVQVLAAMS